jgi:hypothetical protein
VMCLNICRLRGYLQTTLWLVFRKRPGKIGRLPMGTYFINS